MYGAIVRVPDDRVDFLPLSQAVRIRDTVSVCRDLAEQHPLNRETSAIVVARTPTTNESTRFLSVERAMRKLEVFYR